MAIRVWLLLLVLCVAVAGSSEAQEKAVPGKAVSSRAETAGDGAPLNVNNASAEQLEALPGIGAAMAGRIIEYRQKHGPFKRLEDLMNVRGIGEKNFQKLKPLITVASGKGDRGGSSEH
jgi:competence protein ComEA